MLLKKIVRPQLNWIELLKAKEWLLIALQGNDPCKVDNDQTSMKVFSKIYIHKYAQIKKKKSSIAFFERPNKLDFSYAV